MQPDLDRLLRESRSAVPDPDPAAMRRGIEVVLARLGTGRGGRRYGVFSAAIVALLAASLAVAAERIVRDADRTQAVAASRIIDRTLLCEVALRAGVRSLDIKANGALRQGPNAHGAAIDLFSPWSPDAYLAGIGEGTLTLNHKRCRPLKTRVRLQRRGLSGGPLGPFGDTYDCSPPRFVRVRLRASFRSRVSLRPTVWDDQAPFPVMRARGRVQEGYIAVQTRVGKPLLFGSVADSKPGRLFTADSCIPE
jgi:hypothetical protein